MTKRTDVTMRLSVKGRDELLKTMRDMGGEYAKAAKRIESGSKDANVAIKSVNTAAKEGHSALEGYAQRGGLVGRVLKDLGPVGLAAGATIGAVTVALGAAMKVAREAVSAFDALGKSADTLQMTTDLLQGLKAAAADEGVAFAQVETAARSLTKAHADLMRGSGQLYNSLKTTNPQLLEMLRNTTSNDERFRILTSALQGAQSQTEKNTIAYAAFGESGLAVARMLERQQGGIDGMIAKYREMGLIVREDVIRNAEDMETKFGVAAQVIDLQLKQAFIDLAPFLIQAAELAADVAKAINDIIASTKSFSDRTSPQLEATMGSLMEGLRKAGFSQKQIMDALASGEELDLSGMRRVAAIRSDLVPKLGEMEAAAAQFFPDLQRVYAEMGRRAEDAFQKEAEQVRTRTEKAVLEQRREALKAAIAETKKLAEEAAREGDAERVNQFMNNAAEAQAELARIEDELARRAALPTARDPAAEAAAAAAAKAREAELNRLRTEAIALQKQLGDYTAYLANETARYQKLLDEGLITQAQYDAAVKSLTDELAGVTAATDLWKGVIEAARTPVEVITDKMEKLDDDLAKGRINIDLYRKAMELLTGELAKASDAADQAAPGFKDAEAIRAELERVANEALSPAAKLAKEQERINALVKAGQLDPAAATDWLVLYKKRLDEATQSMGLLAASERLLDGIQQGRIRTWGDMKQAIGDLLIEMVRQYLAAQKAMGAAGTGGDGGLLGQIFNFGKSVFQPGGWGGGNVGASHSGGLGISPQQTRRLGAGRLGNERLQYIREDEEVLTSYGKMNIASQLSQLAAERAAMSGLVTRALAGAAGGGGGDVNVSVHNYAGAEVEVTQREGPDGPEVSIDVRGEMKNMARSGVFDGPFKERYGLTPRA